MTLALPDQQAPAILSPLARIMLDHEPTAAWGESQAILMHEGIEGGMLIAQGGDIPRFVSQDGRQLIYVCLMARVGMPPEALYYEGAVVPRDGDMAKVFRCAEAEGIPLPGGPIWYKGIGLSSYGLGAPLNVASLHQPGWWPADEDPVTEWPGAVLMGEGMTPPELLAAILPLIPVFLVL